MDLDLLNQAAAFAETVTAEPTFVTGVGEVLGIVDRFGAERALKKGAIGTAAEGTITIAYRRELFTTTQIEHARSGSVKVPSLSSVAFAIQGIEYDTTWVTITAATRG